MIGALAMLKNTNYLIFILAQLVVSGMMQFYFLGTGQFMQDRGVSGRNVSAAMGIAHAVQAAATILLLGMLLGQWLLVIGVESDGGGWRLQVGNLGYQWTFVVGALCWSTLYLTYVLSKRAWPVVLIQAFHGLAYALFMIGGQMFVGKVAPPEIGASAQSVIFIATVGVGLFLGTQLAGFVMEKNSAGGKFQWAKIWMVPLAITLAGAIVFAVAFKVPDPAEFLQDKPPQEKAAVASNP